MTDKRNTARFIILWKEPSDREAFDRHYREVHIPLAKQLPGLRRYTISRDPRPVRGEEWYYQVAELEWETMEELQQAFRSPAGQQTAEDVAMLTRLSPGVVSMICDLEDV